jgi:glycosyltransferase involved in cell wall biosynthesis
MVSVITAVYNTKRFLRNAVESVANQSRLPIEHILVDDCSTDGSLELARELSHEYPHVRIIPHEKNLGFPSALNTGILAASSDYVAIFDSDDIALPHWLETVVPVLDHNPNVGSVGGGCIVMTDCGEITGFTKFCDSRGDVTEDIKNGKYSILHTGTVHRKKIVLSIGGYNAELKSLEDNDIYLGISSVSQIFHVGLPLLLYRRLPSSESRKSHEFSLLAKRFLNEKAKLLKDGATIAEANVALAMLIMELKCTPRLDTRLEGEYELEMGQAFIAGKKRSLASKMFLRALAKRTYWNVALKGLLRCYLPSSFYNLLKLLIKN